MADEEVLVEGAHAWTLEELRADLAPRGLYVVTAAEKAVLDAMAQEYIVPGVHPRFAYSGEGACRAELARREAAK